MFGFSKALARWRRKRRGSIAITSHGFDVSHGKHARDVRWDEITKIEAFRIPGSIVEDFCVVFFSDANEPLVVDDIYPEFLKFQEAVWQHWPEIKDRWIAIYLGPPNERERVVLWEKQKT